MANKFLVKATTVANRVPTPVADFVIREIALNTYDGRMFFIKNNGTNIVVEVATADRVPTNAGAGATGTWGIGITGNAATATALATARTVGITGAITGTATSFNGSSNISIPITNVDLTAASLSGALPAIKGGTGLTSYSIGDVLYASSTTALSTLAAGGANFVLRSNGAGTPPSWVLLDTTFLPDSIAKKSVKAATTANITLSGLQTIDGISLIANDLALVKNQTLVKDNGWYVVSSGSWSRAVDGNTASLISGALVKVDQGTVNGGLIFTTNFKTTDTLGTSAINWSTIITDGATAAAAAASATASNNSAIASAASAALANTYASNAAASVLTAPSTYVDITTGLAAVVANAFFSVPGPTGYYLSLYQKVSGVAVAYGSMYNSDFIDTVQTTQVVTAFVQAAAIAQLQSRLAATISFPP